ncbi:rhomboid family intramembrane serine protease [Brumimicrobium aurantiacum]|uniref:Rhomboid family intramembrane serine protease n=1 Tax=Brumimicrobium aurantiacum TaxID=1737063 RepID=A0A3E1EW08_9FLAO|nr:rhomboid family intramembrane serine protease [Brumimicrobium aurantiacum]RFC53739.1 rhomboid family intramembrane serine protease [Brumimicrobium aurantiacum]
MKMTQLERGRTLEAIIYPLLLLVIMWSVFLIDRFFHLDLYRFGVKPQTLEGIKGIFLMPFIHGQRDFSHIINNSIPTFVLLSALIYFYREIALYVVLFIWIGGGFLLWYIAQNTLSYHIGMSGVIYGLFGFLFMSGFFKKYLPLQAISLFVAFVYGSMIWGIFPMEEGISWEGHLSGLLVGALLAYAFRKKGPVPPKYAYEIEKEMGIEPPDLEGEWKERRRIWEEQQIKKQEELQRRIDILEGQRNENPSLKEDKSENKSTDSTNSSSTKGHQITYHFVPKKKE